MGHSRPVTRWLQALARRIHGSGESASTIAGTRGVSRARCTACWQNTQLTGTNLPDSIPLSRNRVVAGEAQFLPGLTMTALPELDGVQHRFVDLGDGVTIHVAEAGHPKGRP